MVRHSYGWLLLLAFACDDPSINYGPCEFAPPESRFPLIESVDPCDECYFNIQMMGKEYAFIGKQFETSPKSIIWSPPEWPNQARSTGNSFFDFHFVSPQKAELLVKSVGGKNKTSNSGYAV